MLGALLQAQAIELLRRAWDDALTFERASRSLAKTGSSFSSFLVSFLECFLGAQRGPNGFPKRSKIDQKDG